jgi:hypothetical protein
MTARCTLLVAALMLGACGSGTSPGTDAPGMDGGDGAPSANRPEEGAEASPADVLAPDAAVDMAAPVDAPIDAPADGVPDALASPEVASDTAPAAVQALSCAQCQAGFKGCITRCVAPETGTRFNCLTCLPLRADSCDPCLPCPPPPGPCQGTMCGDTCTNLDTDASNCGACGRSCYDLEPKPNGGTPVCMRGTCVRQCGPGFAWCGTRCASLANDSDHCGACGRACASTEVCASGACAARTSLALAGGLTDPLDLALDADAVYFTDATDGTISRVARGGGAVTVLARNQAKPARIAVDATHVYWSNVLGASVMRARKDGSGQPELLASAVAPTDLVAIADSVYWVDNGATTHELRKVPRAGGTPILLATCGSYEDLERDVALPEYSQLVRDGTLLFFGCAAPTRQYSVIRVDTANADAKTMLASPTFHRGPILGVSGDYFCHLGGGLTRRLVCLDKNGGASPERSLPIYAASDGPSAPAPGQMVASGCGLFWWAQPLNGFKAGDFVSWSLQGSAVVPITRGAVEPRRTVVDSGFLFFTDKTAVVKMPIP